MATPFRCRPPPPPPPLLPLNTVWPHAKRPSAAAHPARGSPWTSNGWLLSQPQNRPHGPTRSLSTGPAGPAGPAPSDSQTPPGSGPCQLALPRTPPLAARPAPPHGTGPAQALSPALILLLLAPGHPLRFRPGPFNLAHPPRAQASLAVPALTSQSCSPSLFSGALHAAPALTRDSSKQHLRSTHRARLGGHDTLPSISGAQPPDSDADSSANRDSPSRGPPPQGDWQVTGIGVRRQRHLATHGAAGRELHTTALAVCILERHPTTAILPSYLRTSWVRSPRQQHASPPVRGCRDSTDYIQVTGHARGGKFL